MHHNKNTFGKDKSDIYMISENNSISNNTKRKKKKTKSGRNIKKMEVLSHQAPTQIYAIGY